MLTVEVELLGGRYAATSQSDRGKAEWPPHPARFYSALVAALHDGDAIDPHERAALLWLEAQEPPALDVHLEDSDVGRRDVRDVWVPVNDVSVVGDIDPEADVRAARVDVEALAEMPRTTERDRALKTSQKALAKAEAKLAALVQGQSAFDATPSAVSVRAAVALLPERRTRQLRTFPVVVPARSTFAFIWPGASPGQHGPAIQRLCDRVSRLGHSSSLVRCAVVDGARAATLVPDADGDYVLRTIGPGQLERLEREFERHQGLDSRVLPARPQRYAVRDRADATSAEAHAQSVFSDEWILFERVGGGRPLSSRGGDLAHALRRALLEAHGTTDLPPALSGHRADGAAADTPHLAFIACPYVGHDHADGSVQGLAIVLPRNLDPGDRERLFRMIGQWESKRRIDAGAHDERVLEVGTSGPHTVLVQVRRVDVTSKVSLSPRTWSRPSRRFLTATPIMLDRHPGDLRSNTGRTAHRAAAEAAETIALSCERIGLPRPSRVEVSLAPLLSGAQPVRAFGPLPARAGRVSRVRVHAEIEFDQKVRGPVLLGAGRYLGFGLCLPVGELIASER